MNIFNLFIKYVSLNILGMIGLSCYILADTFFVARGIGADGLTALNIAIPIYNFINGLGLMIGMGSATKYAILKTQSKDNEANTIFTNALIYVFALYLFFIIIALFFTKDIAYQCAIPLDDAKMHEAAQYLIGKHDFSALNSSPLSEYPDQVRTVESIEIVRHGHMIEMTFQAKGFLRYMVRMMSAAIIEAGKGKIQPTDVKELLESCDKSHSKRNAPACGLTLEEVNYYDVMAMSEEAIIREYILKDETDNLPEKEEHIRNRVFPMQWIVTTRRNNTVLGEAVFDETGIHIHVNKEEDIPIVETLYEDIHVWLSENGYDPETRITADSEIR